MAHTTLGTINQRYRLLEKLGEGGMAVVYRARDTQSDEELAVKVMKTTLTGSSKKRFVREFRAIAGIDHPHCIKVYEFGETAEFPFFTMELFAGRRLTTLAGGDLTTVLEAIRQAAEALDFVHSRKMIHRDVKPSNLLLILDDDSDPQNSGPMVKLTDFGLARYYGVPSSISVESGFAGTLAYAAPEQISNATMDHRVDLYSLGVVSFEMLTGRHPFHAAREAGVQKLMRAQLADHPPRLRELNPAVPPELEDVVLAYMEKDPSRRPRSAASLLKVTSALLGRTGDRASSTNTFFFSAGERDRSVVGRGSELSELDRLLRESLSPTVMTHTEWMQSPTPSAVFLMGEAGIGKSHLMREVHRTARRQGAAVFEGRCFKGNLAPYHPFVDIVRQMLVGLQRDDSSVMSHPPAAPTDDGMETAALARSTPGAAMLKSDRDSFQGLVDYYSAELLRIAPDLRQWLPGEAFRQVELNRETNYVMRAVASFFVEVGTLHGACLFIEDLQWADLSTLDLLRHLAAALFRNRERSIESNHSPSRLFICCTVRSGEAGGDSFPLELQRERYGRIMHLTPLSLEECRELICRQLGAGLEQASSALVERMHQQCQGNPYFISESVFNWRDTGRIVCGEDTWRLDESTGEGSAWPDSVRDVLRSRLESLSPAARRTLGACAVIGSVIDTDLLRQVLADMDEADFLDGVDELLERQIVLEKRAANQVEFSHDLLRELAYEQLSGNRRRMLHAHAGEALEADGAAEHSPELLAGHFYEARVVNRAFPYLLDAATAALETYAVDDAQRHLKRAAELEQEVEQTEQKMRLHELAATAYGAAGAPLKAVQCYEKQLTLAGDSLATGRILEEIGKLHFRVGDFDESVRVFDEALKQIGYRRTRSAFGALTSTSWSMLRHSLPRWLSYPFATQRGRQRMRVAHGVFSTLELLWAQRDVLQCGQAHGRHLLLADQIGELPFLVHAFARQALIFGIFSLNRQALRASRRALAYARQSGDAEGQAVAKGHVGCAHFFGARLEEAEQLLREAVTVLNRRGDTWERMYFYHNLRHLYSITGDAEQEIASAKVEMQIGEAVHDPEGTCWGAYGMANAMARSGRLDEAHQFMERALGILAGRTNIVVTPTALQTYGYVHLQSGEYEAARKVLEQSCRDISRHWAFVDYTVRAYPLYAESLLGPNWHKGAEGPTREDALRSWKVSRQARFWAWRFPNYMPHALRVRGRAAWVIGKQDKAVRCLLQAIKTGDKIGARYDVARACIDLSRLPVDDSQQHLRRGRDLLTELGAALPQGEEV